MREIEELKLLTVRRVLAPGTIWFENGLESEEEKEQENLITSLCQGSFVFLFKLLVSFSFLISEYL